MSPLYRLQRKRKPKTFNEDRRNIISDMAYRLEYFCVTYKRIQWKFQHVVFRGLRMNRSSPVCSWVARNFWIKSETIKMSSWISLTGKQNKGKHGPVSHRVIQLLFQGEQGQIRSNIKWTSAMFLVLSVMSLFFGNSSSPHTESWPTKIPGCLTTSEESSLPKIFGKTLETELVYSVLKFTCTFCVSVNEFCVFGS